MGVRALILINNSGVVGVGRQTESCWRYIADSGMTLAGFLRAGSGPAEAARAIEAGQAEVIVTAYRDPKLELTGEIESVGGRVEYVLAHDHGKLTVRGIIASLHRRLGWSTSVIARAIGGDTKDVRDHLRRAGIKPPREE